MRHLLLATTVLAPLAAQLAPAQAGAATYTVVSAGTTPAAGQFASLNALAQAQLSAPFLQPGDEVDVQAATYVTPSTEAKFYNIGTPAAPVTFKAIGGYAYLPSTAGVDKGELTFVSSDVVVDGFIFAGNPGGASDDSAGIRADVNYGLVDANGHPYANNITVRNSAFLMAADGVLADDCSSSPLLSGQYGHTSAGVVNTGSPCSITLDHDWFAGNGNGSGLDHQVYLARYDQVTITNSLFQGGFDGHLIKSRAFNTDIENNRIIEGPFAVSNSLIDFPVGGNETVKNNVMEIGPGNYNGFINYNEEAWPPTLNNPGRTLVITGNTVIDDYSAAHPGHTPFLLWDDSNDTDKGTAPLTHAPAGSVANTTITGNTIYSPTMNATNSYATVSTYQTLNPSNIFATTGAPALNTTPPVAWPPAGTATATLNVAANGFPLPNGDGTYTYPELVLWFDGLPLLPAPAAVTADQTTGATQTVTYQVPALAGAPHFLSGQEMNGQCCLGLYPTTLSMAAGSATVTVDFPNHRQRTGHIFTIGWGPTAIGGITIPVGFQAPITVIDANHFSFQAPAPAITSGTVSTQVYTSGANSVGLALNVSAATLNGEQATNPGYVMGETNNAVFAAQSASDPPPPVLALPTTLTLSAGATASISLSATDPNATAAQLTYTVTTAPAHGTLALSGNPLAVGGSFTQAQVAAGNVTYTAGGIGAAADSFAFALSDPSGNSVAGVQPVMIMPAPYRIAPGVALIPHANGTWGWK